MVAISHVNSGIMTFCLWPFIYFDGDDLVVSVVFLGYNKYTNVYDSH